MRSQTFKILGEATVRLHELPEGKGRILSEKNIKNISTDVYRAALLQRAYDSSNKIAQMLYGVGGVGLTPESIADTQLVNETQRVAINPITGFTQTGTTLDVTFVFGGSWTGTLYEIGIVGGPSASSSANSGDLYFRTTINGGETKANPNQSISIQWTITISDV